MKEEDILQSQIIQAIEEDLGKKNMVPVWGSYECDPIHLFLQSYLIPNEMAQKALNADSITVGQEALTPGIISYGFDEDAKTKYHRYNNDFGAEPIVIQRDFAGVVEDYTEISEEFRLLFNLYYDKDRNSYLDVANGEFRTVAQMDQDGFIMISKKYLKDYLAVKEMCLAIQIDSRCAGNICDSDITLEETIQGYSEAEMFRYTLSPCENIPIGNRRSFSLLYAKKIIQGGDLHSADIWPFNCHKDEEEYPSFIIGIDDNGKDIEHTCNPDQLNSLFDTYPGQPQYLTPVYFDPKVLGKYYESPKLYHVGDGIIRCGAAWQIQFDRHRGFVSAYLGDLGRDLPTKAERLYWKSFNRSADVGMSEAKIKRDFYAEFASSDAPDLLFKRTYTELNRVFEDRLGAPLFISLNENDQYNFETLHLLLDESIKEFDQLVLGLVKSLIDALNVKLINRFLSGEHAQSDKSIDKLEAWFATRQLEGYSDHIDFLRNLQALRSTGTAHLKGRNYEKACNTFDVRKGNYGKAFSGILNSATEFLEYVKANLDALQENNKNQDC